MLIAQISDSHISVPAEAGDNRIEDLRRCVTYLNGLVTSPSLVVHTGDISHNGTREEYTAAAAILQQLRVTLFVMMGNRDNRTVLRDAFADHLPDNCHPHFIQYMTEIEGTCLLMLDTVSNESNKGRLCDERLTHLAGMLDQTGGNPVIIFMHHPTFEIVESRYPFQFEDRANADAFATLVDQHPNVRAVRCGHTHRQAISDVAGTTASTIPSIAEDLRLGDAAGLEVIAPLLQLT